MNFDEALIHELIAQKDAILVEVEAMKAHDAHNLTLGPYHRLFTDESYRVKSQQILDISAHIGAIARRGNL